MHGTQKTLKSVERRVKWSASTLIKIIFFPDTKTIQQKQRRHFPHPKFISQKEKLPTYRFKVLTFETLIFPLAFCFIWHPTVGNSYSAESGASQGNFIPVMAWHINQRNGDCRSELRVKRKTVACLYRLRLIFLHCDITQLWLAFF